MFCSADRDIIFFSLKYNTLVTCKKCSDRVCGDHKSMLFYDITVYLFFATEIISGDCGSCCVQNLIVRVYLYNLRNNRYDRNHTNHIFLIYRLLCHVKDFNAGTSRGIWYLRLCQLTLFNANWKLELTRNMSTLLYSTFKWYSNPAVLWLKIIITMLERPCGKAVLRISLKLHRSCGLR